MPETLGFALSDSPVGLAAWVVEKFQKWSDPDAPLETKFARDDLLSNVMIYWLTNSITSSMRLYRETLQSREAVATFFVPVPAAVPTALSLFPHELFPPADTQVARHFPGLVRGLFAKHAKGGHFAALEETAALTADLLGLVRAIDA